MVLRRRLTRTIASQLARIDNQWASSSQVAFMSLPEKQSQDSFRLLVETASCMIVILREDHSIAYFNSFAERLTVIGARPRHIR